MELLLGKDNIDIEKIMNENLESVSAELKDNPQFMWCLYQELRFLTRSYEDQASPSSFSLSISPDGKSFEIASGIRRAPDCRNDRLKNNKNYSSIKFSLDDKKNMEVLRQDGTFFNFNEYVNEISDENLRQRFMAMGTQTPTIISTYHRHRTFLSNGIEVESSTFSDQYPLGCAFSDDDELRAETRIHAPAAWPFNLLPEMPRYTFAPVAANAHRFIDQLGIINMRTSRKIGQTEVSDYQEYQTDLEYPDLLQTGPVPIIEFKDGKLVVSQYVEKDFPGMTINEVKKEISIRFLQGINSSKTKEIAPELAAEIERLAKEGLKSKYHMTFDTDQEKKAAQ